MLSKFIPSCGEYRGNWLGILLTVIAALLSAEIVLKNYLIAVGLFAACALVIVMLLVLRRYSGDILTNFQLLLIFFPLIFLYVTGIPKIGSLPLSPLFFFIGIYVLISLLRFKHVLQSFKQSSGKVFLLLLVCWCVDYFLSRIFLQFPYLDTQLLEIIGIFLATSYFIDRSPKRAIWATRVLSIVLFISMVWFVGENLFKELSEIRLTIYQSYLQKLDDRVLLGTVAYANGLSPLLFLFGYQIAAALPLYVLAVFNEKNRKWKMFYVLGSVISLFAMLFAGERSVFLAAAISISMFLYKRKSIKLAAFLMLLSLASMFMISLHESERQVVARLQSAEQKLEVVERLKLQMVGVVTIINNPMGLVYEGKRWGDEAASYGVDFRKFGNEEIAVHNGYLGRVISYGWFFGFLIVLTMVILIKNIKAVLSCRSSEKDSQVISQAQIIAYTLISILIQALFHNSSIFSFNGPSLTVMFLFLAWSNLVRSCNHAEKYKGKSYE